MSASASDGCQATSLTRLAGCQPARSAKLADIRSQTAAVIPAYQDEKHIGDIARRTRERLDHVLVVDDGSTDRTGERAREAGAEVIVHDQNLGKGEAIKTGLAHWLGTANPQIDWVILLDSDGQHLPEEIDRFLSTAASLTRPTFFIGNRMNDVARMPFLRRVVNRYMSDQISRICGQKIPDTQCGYRMLASTANSRHAWRRAPVRLRD